MSSNNAIVLKKYIDPTEGYPKIGEHFGLEERPYNLEAVKVDEEHPLLLRNIYTSIDPYIRIRMQNPKYKSYLPSLELGQAIPNLTLAEVVKSAVPEHKTGSHVVFLSGWEEYTLVPKQAMGMVKTINNEYNLPLMTFVGALGMPSQTAYVGLKHIGQPKAGETIYVSAASGAVGQVVGQLAKSMGLYVVGSAGSDEKLAHLKDIGYDAVFNYKKENVHDALPRVCPKGIDIYFENVGGETMDAVLLNANFHARIIFCGCISQYNNPNPYGLKNYPQLLTKSIKIEGFIVFNLLPLYQEEYFREMPKLIAEGKLKYKYDVYMGLGSVPEGLLAVLQGNNFGKALSKIADE
ncbi:NADP-dependent oxidoreductase, implicated in cellular detoxification [Schizosaccharomyces osmophilus]|uniref:NADP-dependent oxidoreductase, implicated in cellular detoxification n=1 Tax=Schizosaccharomyces osmophilus TaxID=2545709 RepID=A0AAE9W783_9SCHI|nr:NADP-dependent oxidoreductase, implicated in cellular detoxification [Schizosaccharomyces osmophilus]WBW71212.1 NADP-dependent oxidoreductase, implicated in cellular detoxification [Schizosaccharomyces osmophilus]